MGYFEEKGAFPEYFTNLFACLRGRNHCDMISFSKSPSNSFNVNPPG